MLLNNLYSIVEIRHEINSINAIILLHEDNEIFKGHFPETPVLPGVCQVELCKEIFNRQMKLNYSVKEAASIKFLAFISPAETKELDVIINYTETDKHFDINASLKSGEKSFLKLIAKLSPLE